MEHDSARIHDAIASIHDGIAVKSFLFGSYNERKLFS